MNLNNAASGQNKRTFKITEFIAHGSNVTSCTLGHKSNRIAATGGDDKKVNLWTLANKPICIMSLTGHTSAVHSISFSSNEDKIVSGSASGSVKVWDLECNKQICNLSGHKSSVTCLEYHTYADYIASGSVDCQIRLWDLRRKGCIFTYKGHSNCVNSLRFSPDNKWIASAADDGLIKIWDLKAGKLLIDLKGHQAAVNSLEFHPNEYLLATASTDRTVKFWDLEKMENVSTSPLALSSIKVIEFEPSGQCLFSASHDYLQSVSWEPSEIYDSVYCQWKTISDMCISSNRLIACSYSNNTASFYAVDLCQVAPVGVATQNDDIYPVTSPKSTPPISHNTTSNRKNFRHFDKIEASEQPQEDVVISNECNDNAKSDIFNQEEYNKIFRPYREIQRQITVEQSVPNMSNQEPKKSILTRKPTHEEKQSPTKGDNKKQDFFIDIRTNQPPPAPISQPVTSRPPSTLLSPNFNSNNIKQNLYNEPSNGNLTHRQLSFSGTEVQQQPKMKISTSFTNISENTLSKQNENKNDDLANNLKDKLNIDSVRKSVQSESNKIDEQLDLISTIELGHDSFIKAVKSRHRHLQSVCVMWNSGNIKPALDHAVNISDRSLMADILSEINSISSLWNLDVATILLPSIKDLMNSRYEEHMLIGSESCKLIFKMFGKLIKSNLVSAAAVGVGVDISREERQSKCRACYNNFLDIMAIIEKKQSLITSTKLVNNFREINLLMKTIE